MYELCILFDNKDMDKGLLAGFPYLEGQYLSHEEEGEVGRTWVMIDLGEHKDTTAAQDQYLDTLPEVIGYTIRKRRING